jgi:hypothetical protein
MVSPKLIPVRTGSVLEAAIQVNISLFISRAYIAITHRQNTAAKTLLIEALNLASQLSEPAIPQGRCYFWQGVIADRTNKEDLCPQFFVAAIPCLNHSREGERLLPYILKYWTEVLEWMRAPSQETTRPETREQWRKALKEAQNLKSISTTETMTDPFSCRRHSLPSPLKATVDAEDEDLLYRLVGEDDDHGTHIFHHEVKAGSKARPKAVPGSTVPHSLPEDGLMKAIPLGGL